jgi:tetratricopeptide (TPR) repeat protein
MLPCRCIEQPRACAASVTIALLTLLAASGQAVGAALGAPLGLQLVQLIDTDEREGHVDISVQFACTMRYLSNAPLNHGNNTVITLRLGPDCGSFLSAVAPEFPLVGGGSKLVTGARLESVVPGEVTLEFTWSRDLDFVMVPTANGQGLRIRLLGMPRGRAGGFATVIEAPEGYAVNLDSSMETIDPAAVQAAATRLGTAAYVSTTDIEDKHWYRLRVGPFTTRQEAERVLRIAQTDYPRAWIAINDEAAELTAVERAGAQAVAAGGQTDPPLPAEQRDQILRDARVALAQRQFPEAVELLTRLLRQPEYPTRADAQELIGLVRERAGQLAHAKAEYQEYLRRYPDGPAATRVRGRLLTLATAAQTPQSSGEFGSTPARSHWSMAGSGAVTYEYGQDQLSSGGTSTNTTALNAVLVYGDLLVRDRGERYEFTGRVNSGYTANMAPHTGGSQDRTNIAYVELDDRVRGLSGRVGRQSLASQGNIGLFDGVYVGYQLAPKLMLSAAGGFPAYTSYSQFGTKQTFGTLSAEFGPYRQAWVFDGYLFDERNGGATERRALGLQTRYLTSGRSFMLLTDYDIAFQQLNSLTLIGNLSLWHRWVLGFDADHRRSPLLLLGNALIGQSAPDLAALQLQFTPSQIRQLALDRTATSDTYTLSATHPLGERWQFIGYLSALQLSRTPASGGVAATPATGLDKTVSLQMSGASLLQASDLHFFGVRYDNSPLSRSVTLSWDARFVLPGTWRIGPRFSVERVENPALGGTQMLYLPELRSDWTGRRNVFELIGGYQVQQQQPLTGQSANAAQSARNLYLAVTYRMRF